MTTSATEATPALPSKVSSKKKQSVYMVLGCTVFAAAAQVLMKFGATHAMPRLDPATTATWMPFLAALLGNWQLLLGYALHACNAFLLILALREGELSMLYPIIALTYVWVNLLSIYFFAEQMNWLKAAGIALIIGGVGLLGRVSTVTETQP